MATTYILQCSDDSYYVGSTRLPVKLVYTEEYETLNKARHREMQIKGWSRLKKDMSVLSLFACPELVEGEDGIRLAYIDFLENPMRAER